MIRAIAHVYHVHKIVLPIKSVTKSSLFVHAWRILHRNERAYIKGSGINVAVETLRHNIPGMVVVKLS